ncbi:winged helix-turn-helix domain-containing protein [Pilimelia columellifera]|uniref:HTH gntR-type domain-containing protein n=1 Tax=Pilimelia columellifera subsp. columellifera TaxID=706583 RepID=A0ABN3ND20_9ACTN
MRIADELRERIQNGTYPIGGTLPSTTALMAEFGVSITVARGAVKELQAEGVAVGQPGKAVYVEQLPNDRGDAAPGIADRLDRLAATVQRLESRVAVLEGRASA